MQPRLGLVLVACALAGCSALDVFGVFTFGDGGASGDGSMSGDGGDLDGGGGDLSPVTCGGPLQACCPTGPACVGGGCCVAMICHASGTETTPTTVCINGVSAPCGATGQPCCAANSCKSQGCCVGGECFQQGSSCGNNSGTNGSCSGGASSSATTCAPIAAGMPCGGFNQGCCPGSRTSSGKIADYCVASGLACNPGSGMCQTCGGQGEACCDGNACDNGGCCDGKNNFTCLQDGDSCPGGGKCSAGGCNDGQCGKIGQPCCPSLLGCTSPSSTCQSGTCAPCGGSGESCCPGHGGGFCGEPYVCSAGSICRRCGDIGEPCCAGDSCTGSAKCVAGSCA